MPPWSSLKACGPGARPSSRRLPRPSSFDVFTEDNDPHGEHDFGAFEVADQKIFWKIDYFDLALSGYSPDPANRDVTHRVLTIMLASEY
ncbi:unnamed protein product [Laminaria digitata]